MRDIQKMCRICLGQGSRNIFEQTLGSNLLHRDDLSRIAEKLRFVTMLKVRTARMSEIFEFRWRKVLGAKNATLCYHFVRFSFVFFSPKVDTSKSIFYGRIAKHHNFSFYVCWVNSTTRRTESTIAKKNEKEETISAGCEVF